MIDQWPSRLSLAARQLMRGTFDHPRSQASWTSVVRRSLVVTGFTAYALLTNHLDTAIFAAFGAMQIGLGEAALPLRQLVRLVLFSTLGMILVAGTALWLSGTWWTVVLLTVVAFLQGTSWGAGVIPRTVGIGALAMGVIFAGLQANPLQATLWLAIGAITQSLSWLLLWHRERALSVKQSIRNALVKVTEMVQAEGVTGTANNEASAHVDEAVRVIIDSGVPNRSAALRVTDAIADVRRNVVAWRELRRPGLSERLRVTERLHHCEMLLTEARHRFVRPEAQAPQTQTWAVSQLLDGAIDGLDEALAQVDEPDEQPAPQPVAKKWSPRSLLQPQSLEFRHGLRMAIAIAVAQSLSLLLPLTHSFWIPLTCVFVVKPDWAFTLTRSVARVGGNLLAVFLIPPVLYVAGANSLAIICAVLIVSAVAFRFFTGNYILGSFGIAGTILILDQLLNHNPELYVSRIIATFIGAAVGICISALIPSWRSGEAVRLLRDVASGLTKQAQQTTRGVLDPASVDVPTLRTLNDNERHNLLRLRPAAEAAMLEPNPVVDPRFLSVAVEAAGRAHLALLALGFHARILAEHGRTGLDVAAQVASADASFASACDVLELDVPHGDGPMPPSVDVRRPDSPEDGAVVLESIRLAQAAQDFAQAVEWVATSSRKPADAH